MDRSLDINGSQQFDLRTTIRDPKTAKVLKTQDYVRYVSKENGEYYKDITTGKFFDPQGKEIKDPKKTLADK